MSISSNFLLFQLAQLRPKFIYSVILITVYLIDNNNKKLLSHFRNFIRILHCCMVCFFVCFCIYGLSVCLSTTLVQSAKAVGWCVMPFDRMLMYLCKTDRQGLCFHWIIWKDNLRVWILGQNLHCMLWPNTGGQRLCHGQPIGRISATPYSVVPILTTYNLFFSQIVYYS